MKYRRKPVEQFEVEAQQWNAHGDHPEVKTGMDMVFDGQGEYNPGAVCQHCDGRMRDHGWIKTLSGWRLVCPGDWIVNSGMFSGGAVVCRPDVFAATYEAVEAVA